MIGFITWFVNDDLAIYFSDTPRVCVRYVLPSMTILERQSIKKFPFLCKTKLDVIIFDYKKDKKYKFTIPKNYCYDGASVPRFFHRLIGAPTDNSFLISSLCHDVLWENPQSIDDDRQLSTDIFDALLSVSDVQPFKRFLMKHSVNIYQSCQKKWRNHN